MKTTIYRDTSGFDALAHEWDDLLVRVGRAPIFMHYTYQRTWWQYLGINDLVLMAIHKDGQLVGLAPLFGRVNEAGQRELTFVGYVDVSDYLDLLVDKDLAPDVHQVLLDCLDRDDELTWDKLYLCSLPHYSDTHTQLTKAAQDRGWRVAVSQQDVCPVIALADSWDSYLAGINKNSVMKFGVKCVKLSQRQRCVGMWLTQWMAWPKRWQPLLTCTKNQRGINVIFGAMR
jgi:hypothetical protein